MGCRADRGGSEVLAVSACCCLHVRLSLLLLTHLQHREQQQAMSRQDAYMPAWQRLLLSCSVRTHTLTRSASLPSLLQLGRSGRACPCRPPLRWLLPLLLPCP